MEEIIPKEKLNSLSHETPFFIFSKQEIINKYNDFSKYFPDVSVFYAMKANAEPEILEILDETGSGFEVASIYELDMLEEIGVDPEKIVYGSAIKPAEDIKEFYDYGVRTYAFDSLQELEKISTNAPGSNVYVRIKVDDGGSVFKFSEKFGTSADNIAPFLERAKDLGLVPYGVSFHVGSQASNSKAWAQAIGKISESLNELKKKDIEIQVLNLGGGYPCVYQSSENTISLEEIAMNTLEAYEKLPYKPRLMVEPGRYLVASSAVLISTVIARVQREESEWLFLDVGVYNALFEAMAYQGSTRYRISSMRQPFTSGEKLFALAGPTGDSPDVITREALLPVDIGVGDKLVVHSVGAYSLVATSKFNGFPKPKIIVV